MKLIPRQYQVDAVDAVWNALGRGENPLGVLPTGTGKALCIAEMVRRALDAYPQTRILIVTHSRELVAQNYAEMIGLWPECPAGIYSAGLNRRDIKAQVIFGSIQSLHRKAFDLQLVDLVLIDEAQSIPRNTDTTWRRFLNDLLTINPYMKVVGWTATAYRLDSGMLHKGDGALFSSIAFEFGIRPAIEQGYLCMPVTKAGTTQIDTSSVGTRGGEFIAGQLQAAAMDPEVIAAIAGEIVSAGEDRRGWIAFGCGIDHCLALRAAIQERGHSCEGVFSTTPKIERTAIIEAYRRQEIRCLVSVNALAVGFNAKHVDLVAIARPTKSAGFYVQAVGRGLRLFEGKTDCLIRDFGGNIERFGPVDDIRIKDKQKGLGGDMPVKTCLECEAENPLNAMACIECGAAFPPVFRKVSTIASDLAVLSSQVPSQWADVTSIAYRRHEKPGKVPTLRVDYHCGLARHSVWWCPEHTGFARQKFVSAWHAHGPGLPVPNSVDEALSLSAGLNTPTRIMVRPSGSFTEVVGTSFA